jgi:hypothetical protein
MAAVLTGKAAMPAAGTSRAPKTFEGSEEHIEEFLEQFENCAEDPQLPDRDKVTYIFRYLGRSQKDIFRTLDGYEEHDWELFKTAIKDAFEGAFKEKKYTRHSLIQYTRNNANSPVGTDAELRAYQRGFQAIVHYLLKHKIITEDDRDTYFWFGFHEDTRRILEQRLATTHPAHPRSKPFNWRDVFFAGKYVFDIDAFDKNPPEGFTTAQTVSQSRSQGSTLESHVVTHTVSLPSTPLTTPGSDDLDSILRRMKAMDVKDQEYANVYTRLQEILPKPAVASTTTTTPKPSTPCFFCKDMVNIHRTRECPVAQEYLRLGKVALSSDGFWQWPNGDRLRPNAQGFKFVIDQAAARLGGQAAKSSSATVGQALLVTVDPITTPTAIASSFIEDIGVPANAFPAQASRKPPGPLSGAEVTSGADKKQPQYQYQTKMDDPKRFRQRWTIQSGSDSI